MKTGCSDHRVSPSEEFSRVRLWDVRTGARMFSLKGQTYAAYLKNKGTLVTAP
jgi:hypothetical protein